MPDSSSTRFLNEKYISLETFKRDGHGVRTPVWFVQRDDVLYVYTEADSWKVKRIRNNPKVRVAVCNVRGTVRGEWRDGSASIIDGDERLAADALLTRKYFLKRLMNGLARLNRHERAMIKIQL